MQIDVETVEGFQKSFRFKDADAASPIMSIGRLADDDTTALFQRNGCMAIRAPQFHVQTLHVVYFVTSNMAN